MLSSSSIYVTGLAAILPQTGESDGKPARGLLDLLDGVSFLSAVDEAKQERVASVLDGSGCVAAARTFRVAGLVALDLSAEFGVDHRLCAGMDESSKLAVGAGLAALRNAGLLEPSGNRLLPEYAESTGLIFASSFPIVDSLVQQLQVDAALSKKLLLKLTLSGSAQLAQIVGARGPNASINAACASTTQAIGIAQDWLQLGRAQRVVVIGGDNITSEHSLPWLGAAFQQVGAVDVEHELGSLPGPFSAARRGMVLSAGGVAVVLETEESLRARSVLTDAFCTIVATHFCNSASHGMRLDQAHMTTELGHLIDRACKHLRVTREEIARRVIYLSHETGTNSGGPGTSCAASEIGMLCNVFGTHSRQIVVTNTKGWTGHAMGVAFEEPIAALMLHTGLLVPLPAAEFDTALQSVCFSRGGRHDRDLVLRFAGGFGGQIAFVLYGKCET